MSSGAHVRCCRINHLFPAHALQLCESTYGLQLCESNSDMAREGGQSHCPACQQEEREAFGRLLLREGGFVDVFRDRYPNVTAYTYWNNFTKSRERNSGWRLDYFLVRRRRQLL